MAKIKSDPRTVKLAQTILETYPPEIRKIIYTINTIEALHIQFCKVTKTKAVFPTD